MIILLILVAVSYTLGAVPVGYLISRRYYGIDIRQHGSGNPGATNVWRVLGKKPGIVTLVLDILKGALPVLLVRLLLPHEDGSALLCGLAAISGHNWSVFLKGSGGKGVATSAGVFLALMPKHTLIALVVFLIVFSINKRVSVGSISAAFTLIVSTFILRTSFLFQLLTLIVSVMILIKHIPNMKRLARGEEPQIHFGGTASGEAKGGAG